jgi:c-di-GMP-binding flagellar brake protein YcgR
MFVLLRMDDLFRSFRGGGTASGRLEVFLVVLFTGAAIAFVIYMIALAIRQALLKRDVEWEEFFDNAAARRLSRGEQVLLADLARKRNVDPPIKILKDYSTFDSMVKAEVAAVEGRPLQALKHKARFTYYRSIRRKLGFIERPRVVGIRSTHNLAEGQHISIAISDGAERRSIESTVVLVDELEFAVEIPANLLKHPAFKTGKLIDLEFYILGDAMYSAHARVTEVSPPNRLRLSHAPDIKRQQKREAVRGRVNGVIYFAQRTGDNIYGPEQEGRLIDISAGGLSLAADRLHEPGIEFRMKFTLGKDREFTIHGVVRRSQRIKLSDGQTILKNHVQFTDLKAQDEDAIVRHIFQSYYKH